MVRPHEVHILISILGRVAGRPRGEILRELGQTGFTLEMLAECFGADVSAETQREWARVQTMPVEALRASHAPKVQIGISEG